MMKKVLVRIAVWTLVLSVGWTYYNTDEIKKDEIRKQAEAHLQALFDSAQKSGNDGTDTDQKTDDAESRLDDAESRIDDTESRIDDTESRIDDIESRISDVENITDDTEDKTDDESNAESIVTESVNTDTGNAESKTDDNSETESSIDDITDTESTADSDTKEIADEFDYPGILSNLSLPSDTPIVNLSRDYEFALGYLDDVMVKCPERIVLVHPDEKIWNFQCDDMIGKWFWADSPTYRRTNIDGVDVMILSFQYNETDPQRIASMQHEVNTIANEIVAGMPNDADTWTKAKIIHDDLVKRLSYDHSVSLPHIRDIYCIVTGNAVCVGYADAFSYLMRWAGESAEVVSNEEHAWNRVTGYQGNDTYVDVTWDDPDFVSETGTTEIKYDYFGLSYDAITAVPSHSLDDGMRPADAGTEGEPFNYYERMGNRLDTYSYNEVLNALANQYHDGEKTLAVQFTNREAYQTAVHELFDNSCKATGQVMKEIGYDGMYWYWCDDSMLVIRFIF